MGLGTFDVDVRVVGLFFIEEQFCQEAIVPEELAMPVGSGRNPGRGLGLTDGFSCLALAMSCNAKNTVTLKLLKLFAGVREEIVHLECGVKLVVGLQRPDETPETVPRVDRRCYQPLHRG